MRNLTADELATLVAIVDAKNKDERSAAYRRALKAWPQRDWEFAHLLYTAAIRPRKFRDAYL
jgi:hypothetical protein